jgi:hypothetical protein
MENPYDNIENDLVVVDATVPLVTGSFAWLHDRVFQPTCANSGCHDGTFEPDFRSIGSSFNTLVNHPVVANDAGFNFEYRVTPGDASSSFLIERLTTDIPNLSGMMPLEVDPGSDWSDSNDSYIDAIVAWIEAGAPDLQGVTSPPPGSVNLPPQVIGFGAFEVDNLSETYPRNPDENYRVEVPAGNDVELWFSFIDDALASEELDGVLRVASEFSALEGSMAWAMESPFSFEAEDFNGAISTYAHRIILSTADVPAGETRYLQALVSDGLLTTTVPTLQNMPVYIPAFSIYFTP